MNGHTLTWKGAAPPYPVDGSAIRPDVLITLDAAGVAAQTIRVGRELVRLGELFDIAPRKDGKLSVELVGGPRLHRLGAGMRSGKMTIAGDAGDELGASMRGGTIELHGDAGHRAGGPDATSDRGMTGGNIVIHGGAGDHVGLRMQRGVIAVAGQVGQSAGYRMLAGTIALGRGPFDHPGLEMRRGTLLLLDPEAPAISLPAFVEEGVFEAASFPVLRMMLLGMKLPRILAERGRLPQRFRLLTGDQFELGKGEVWQWVN